MATNATKIGFENAVPTFNRVPFFPKFAIFFVLLPLILDYKPAVDQSWSVVLYGTIVALSLVSSFFLYMSFGQINSRHMKFTTLSTFIMIIFSIGSGIFLEQKLIDLARTVPPILLFFGTLVSISALAAGNFNPKSVWNAVIWACLFSLVINFILVLFISGIDLSRVRYEILTGATPLASCIFIASFFRGGWNIGSLVLSAINAGLILLSVTRTQMVVALAALTFFIFSARTRLTSATAFFWQTIGLMVLTGLILTVAVAMPQSPLDRWSERMTFNERYGRDPTEITRTAEITNQFETMQKNQFQSLFGFGLAADNRFDDESTQILETMIGSSYSYWTEKGMGHNNYVGVLFVAGFLGGLPIILAQIFSLFRSISVIQMLTRRPDKRFYSSLFAPPLGVAAFMTFGMLGGTFGGRSAAVSFALSIGFTIWLHYLLTQNSVD